jgi:hypothetical protein
LRRGASFGDKDVSCTVDIFFILMAKLLGRRRRPV